MAWAPKGEDDGVSGANWLVTGGSRGLGRAIARAALDAGHRVAVTVRSEADAAAFQALDETRAFAWRHDLADRAPPTDLIDAIWSDLGPVDVFVSNAGYGLAGAVEEADDEEVERLFAVNVFGPLRLLRALLPRMRARRAGRIIVMSSVSGLVGWPALGLYSGAKFALEGLCETLALELAPLGLSLTLVEPGGFRTDFSKGSLVACARTIPDYAETAGRNRAVLAEHHGHEPGDPTKLASAILDLARLETPPRRLLLGRDALSYVTDKLARDAAERAAFGHLTLGTDFDTPNFDTSAR